VPSETDTSIERYDLESETVEGRTTALVHAGPAEDEMESEDGLADESAKDQDLDDLETERDSKDVEPAKNSRSINWLTIFGYVVLPALALTLAVAAGYLKWQNTSERSAGIARIESVAAAKDATIALLSYKPETVEKDLDAARDRLTGTFKDSYTQLTHDVVIPGAKQKHITAVATVPAVASVKATPNHAVVLLYVNQTTSIGTDTPSDSVSTVRVALDNIHGRWLVSEFDPI
jgi:Mce-associated membrane protein